MRRQIVAVTVLGFVVAVGLAACEDKGPMQKAGEKIDRATDKAGKNVDDAVRDLKK
jgi:predicted small lipoprotein YifL